MGLDGRNADIGQFITKPPLIISNIARSAAVNYPGVLDMVISTPTVAELDEDLLKLWADQKPMPSALRQTLAMAIAPARERYNYVLIDCPPGLSLFSSTALIASDYYVAPIIPEPLSLQGVELVRRRVAELRARDAARVEFKGVILNIVKHYRTTHQRTSVALYGPQYGRYQPFRHWLPDIERLRKLGEFDPDLPGQWAGGIGSKFESLSAKYSLSYRLANPVID